MRENEAKRDKMFFGEEQQGWGNACIEHPNQSKETCIYILGSSTYARFSRVNQKSLHTLEDPGISRKSKDQIFAL